MRLQDAIKELHRPVTDIELLENAAAWNDRQAYYREQKIEKLSSDHRVVSTDRGQKAVKSLTKEYIRFTVQAMNLWRQANEIRCQ
jgi:hypothetical protein